jgi:xanthine dehydrogenase YagS FAD-binding subunit
MTPFEYSSPASLNEALGLLGSSWSDAVVLAGGTDLISLMKDGVFSTRRVVNVKDIKDLGGIHKTSHGLRIGSTVTFDELASSPLVRAEYPALHEAALGIASPQIRNMGTVGGDLCQRPRCWYYRGGFGLFAMKDGKSLVPNGENKYHAIFGGGPAYFVSASSLGPPLVALGATIKLASSSGSRTVEAAKFFVIPPDENAREIDLKPNEIVTEILVPPASGVKNATYEIRQREAIDWPLATASVALHMKGSSVAKASIVLGHVAPTPWEASQAAAGLAGKTISEDTASEAAEAAVAGAQPLSQNGYKVQLAKVAVKRALLAAAGKAHTAHHA